MLSFAPYLDVITPVTGLTEKYTPSKVAAFIFSCSFTASKTSVSTVSTVEAISTVCSISLIFFVYISFTVILILSSLFAYSSFILVTVSSASSIEFTYTASFPFTAIAYNL